MMVFDPYATTLADYYSQWLLDLDGTVCHGSVPIAAAVESIKILEKKSDQTIRYITNNATAAAKTVAKKLAAFGLSASDSHIITSAKVAASVAATMFSPSDNIFVLGSPALRDELLAHGFTQLDAKKPISLVVQGLYQNLSWQNLADAAVAIHHGAAWIATNADRTLPSEQGLLPGNGTLIQAIATAVAPKKPIIVGKPNPQIIYSALPNINPNSDHHKTFRNPDDIPSEENIISEAANNSPDRSLENHHSALLDRKKPATAIAVGDRIDTDIAAANAAGIPGLLVLTGASSLKDALYAPAEQRPEFIMREFKITELFAKSFIACQAHWNWSVTPDRQLIITAADKAPQAHSQLTNSELWEGILHTLAAAYQLRDSTGSDLSSAKWTITGGDRAGEQVIAAIFQSAP